MSVRHDVSQSTVTGLQLVYNYIMGRGFLPLYLGFLLGIIPQPMTRWPMHHSITSVNLVSGAIRTQTGLYSLIE